MSANNPRTRLDTSFFTPERLKSIIESIRLKRIDNPDAVKFLTNLEVWAITRGIDLSDGLFVTREQGDQGSPETIDGYKEFLKELIVPQATLPSHAVNLLQLEEIISSFIIEVTYSELSVLVFNDALKPGWFYKITDFQTIHIIQNTTTVFTGVVEPIIVMASGVDTFEKTAYSLSNPSDVIYYDFTSNLCEDGITPRKGKITYRWDTINNVSAYYDWREVRFRRWLVTAKQQESITSLTSTTLDCLLTFSTGTNLSLTFFSVNRRIHVQIGAITHDAGTLTLSIRKGSGTITKPLLKHNGAAWTANELANTSGIITNCLVRDAFVYMNYRTFGTEVVNQQISPVSTTWNIGDGLSYLVDPNNFIDRRTFSSTVSNLHLGKQVAVSTGNNIIFIGSVRNTRIDDNCYNMTFLAVCWGSKIGSESFNNIFTQDFVWTTLEREIQSNFFGRLHNSTLHDHVISSTIYGPLYTIWIKNQVTGTTIAASGNMTSFMTPMIENSGIFLGGSSATTGRATALFTGAIINSLVGWFDPTNISFNRTLKGSSLFEKVADSYLSQTNIDSLPTPVGDITILGRDTKNNVVSVGLNTSQIEVKSNKISSLDDATDEQYLNALALKLLLQDLSAGESYLGVWNADTNTPTITSSVGDKGNYYTVSVGGSTNIDGISSWVPGDEIFFNGTVWVKRPSFAIQSINGKSGSSVTLNQDEIPDGATYKQYSQTEKTKLSGIEDSADVTDAENIGTSIDGSATKATPVQADFVAILDTAAANVLKKATIGSIVKTVLPDGTASGQIAVWNGTNWVIFEGIDLSTEVLELTISDGVVGASYLRMDLSTFQLQAGLTGGRYGSFQYGGSNGYTFLIDDQGLRIDIDEISSVKYVRFRHSGTPATERFMFDGDVYLGGSAAAGNKAAKISDITNTVSFVSVPANSTSSGTVGQMAQDANFLYVCYATNLWLRTPRDLSSWTN